MSPDEIPAEALAAACEHDRTHRPRDGGGWTRVHDDQFRRLLAGLAETGYAVVAVAKVRDVHEMQGMLGYAVIESDGNGSYPSFCVHGPDPVDTDYARAHDQWRYLTEDRPNRRYSICKLVPVEPVQPEGAPEDRLPFDWWRIEQKILDGRLADPVWIEIHEASKLARQRLGIDGTMADARGVPHPFTAAEGYPYDKVEHSLEHYCPACGCIRPLIAHRESFAGFPTAALAEA